MYALTSQNFKKVVKKGKRVEAQLILFINQFKSAVYKKIKIAIAPFFTLHGCTDEREHRVNERIKEILVTDLSIFKASLKKAKSNITTLRSHQLVILSQPVIEESKDEEPLYDITWKLMDKKDKERRKKSECNEQRRLEKRDKRKEDKKNKGSFEVVKEGG